MLDIIVTHYNEPWEVGKKFFDMLDMQRGADFTAFQVIVVNDGEENALPDEHFAGKPYKVWQVSIPHAGVSAARNAGIRATDSEWVMFCDFDDMLGSVYSMREILNVMPANNFDMLWCDILIEDRRTKTDVVLNVYGPNSVLIHGKIYKRGFLLKHKIFFDEALHYSEDTCFNRILNTMIPVSRVGKINSFTPLYIWTDTMGSVTRTRGQEYDWAAQVFESNRKVCEAYRKNLPHYRYCAMVYRTIADAYYMVGRKPMPKELAPLKAKLAGFLKENKKDFMAVPGVTANEIIKAIFKGNGKRKDQGQTQPISDYDIKAWAQKLETEGAQ